MLIRTVFAYKDKSNKYHKYVVISHADVNGDILCVNFTSEEDYKDRTCLVQKREYAGLTKTSCIEYYEALVINQNNLMACFAKNIYKTYENVLPKLLRRIQDGAENSPRFLKEKYARFIEKF